MMIPRFRLFVVMASILFATAACSPTAGIANVPTDDGGQAQDDGGVTGDDTGTGQRDGAGGRDTGSGRHDCTPPHPGDWAITETGLSRACTTASDCQAVYLGDDACEVAVINGVQNMPCPNAAISQTSYMNAYLPRDEAIQSACSAQCGSGSVNCGAPAVYCNAAGLCDLVPPDAGADGGIPLHGLCDPANNQCANGMVCCYLGRPITGAKPECTPPGSPCNPP